MSKATMSWNFRMIVISLLICILLHCQRTNAFLSRNLSPPSSFHSSQQGQQGQQQQQQRQQLLSSSSSSASASSSSSSLYGISEWKATSLETNRTLLLLPFRPEEVLLPGQSRTVTFKQGRFLDLLMEATEDHCSVIGTVLMDGDGDDNDNGDGDDYLLPILPLCEITSYTMEAGFRGKVTSSVTLKCVGRAQLCEIKQVRPYMIARCQPILNDDDDSTTPECLTYAEEIIHDMEQLLQTDPSKQALYQQNFWMALTALDYKPTSLLTRDPGTTNTQKEIEAASWAMLSILETNNDKNKNTLYNGLSQTNLLERLHFGLRTLMEDKVAKADSLVLEQSEFGLTSGGASNTTTTTTTGSSNSAFPSFESGFQ